MPNKPVKIIMLTGYLGAGKTTLLNPKAKDEETLALTQHLTPSQRFDKLLQNQQVLAEPIVRNGKKATVGYCPDVWGAWE